MVKEVERSCRSVDILQLYLVLEPLRQQKQGQSLYMHYVSIYCKLVLDCFLQQFWMAGKKWCEYCRINLPYNKKDIQEHEETRLHLQNKQRAIKFQRMSIQREEKIKRDAQKQNALLSTANIPKAAKGSELEKQIQEYRNSVYNSGRSAIHQLIAEKTKGLYGAPIEFPDKEDLVLAQNFTQKKEGDGSGSDSEQFQMWRIDICEETGDPCFINNVTKAKYYEPPKGYIMSQHQKEEWQNLKEICKEKVDNSDNTVNISEWQEVPQEEDYFKLNRIEEDSEEQAPAQEEGSRKRRHPDSRQNEKQGKAEEMEVKRSWMDELQQKINKQEVDANEVMQTVVYHKLVQCKNLKEKNETLKKLIKGDIQIRQTLDEGLKKDQLFDQVKKQPIGFKSKKKQKTVRLTDDNDI